MDGPDEVTLEWSGWTGRDRPRLVPTRSDAPTFLRFVQALSARGEGYTEVSRGGDPYPALAVSAASGRAVVHRFRSVAESSLLRGDGCLPPHEVVELPVIEGSGVFSGHVVLTLDAAVRVLEAFARGVETDRLGDWVDL